MNALTLIYLIIISIESASLISLFKNQKIGAIANIVSSVISFMLSIWLILLPEGIINSWFYVDFITKVMFMVITTTYMLAALHTFVCICMIKNYYLPPYYYWLFLAIFALTMILAVSSINIGSAWFWLELSTIVSATLILLEHGKNQVESAWRYLLIASVGLGIALFSVILFEWSTGSLVWYNAVVTRGTTLIGILALLGFGTKTGLFPMHTWLPDAHGTAPAPVSGMLSGALLPSALIVYYRIYTVLNSVTLFYLTLTIGILTLWVASLLMIAQKRTKRLLAYSSMDVMGIATVGIALTMYRQNLIYYVLIIFAAHALGKSSLFLATGTLKRMGYDKIRDIRNLVSSSKLLSTAILISAFTVTGAPPFAMFFGEFGVLLGFGQLYIALGFFLTGIFVSFLALNYHVLHMLFGKERGDLPKIPLRNSIIPFGAAISVFILTFWIYIWIWRCIV